jgi:hypothetical protein
MANSRRQSATSNRSAGNPRPDGTAINNEEKLPTNSDELALLRRNVSEAISYLSEFSSEIRANRNLLEFAIASANAAGKGWIEALPESVTETGQTAFPVRWDLLFSFIGEPEREFVRLLRDALRKILSRQKEWNSAFSNPELRIKVIEELGIRLDTDERISDRESNNVAKNLLRIAQNVEDRQLEVGIELVVVAFKRLEQRILEQQEKADFELAGWKSPQQWLKIFEEYDVSMSKKTWQRRIKAGKIRRHPDSTSKDVAIHKSSLPLAYVEKLTGKSP